MFSNVLMMIDFSQEDGRTMTQKQIGEHIGINERNVRLYTKKLLDGKYMIKTKEYKKLGNIADIKYHITPKGRRLLQE